MKCPNCKTVHKDLVDFCQVDNYDGNLVGHCGLCGFDFDIDRQSLIVDLSVQGRSDNTEEADLSLRNAFSLQED